MISNCNNNQYDYENSNKSRNKRQQTHVHEYQGSTMFAERKMKTDTTIVSLELQEKL